MFSNRLWLLKVAATVGLFAWLGNRSHQVLSELEPTIERAALPEPSLRDKIIHVVGNQVLAADLTGFEVRTGVGPMHVLTSTPPPVGSYVTFAARVLAPRRLEALSLHLDAGYAWKRPLNYGVSLLTLAGFLWLGRRRFRWHLEDGVFRGRY